MTIICSREQLTLNRIKTVRTGTTSATDLTKADAHLACPVDMNTIALSLNVGNTNMVHISAGGEVTTAMEVEQIRRMKVVTGVMVEMKKGDLHLPKFQDLLIKRLFVLFVI